LKISATKLWLAKIDNESESSGIQLWCTTRPTKI